MLIALEALSTAAAPLLLIAWFYIQRHLWSIVKICFDKIIATFPTFRGITEWPVSRGHFGKLYDRFAD